MLYCQHCGSAVTVANPTLTMRQAEILRYLETFIHEYGCAPSFDQIAQTFGYKSLATVHEHLTNLERKGVIARRYNESRSIQVLVRFDALCGERAAVA